MIKEKDKDHIFTVQKTKFLLENGLMINQKQEFILRLKIQIKPQENRKLTKIY